METQKTVLNIPMAIVVAGIIIGGAIFLTRGNQAGYLPSNNQKNNESVAVDDSITIGSREISSEDHILGNPAAPIIAVEYSDLECPFCKTYHITLQSLLDQYGKQGQLAWVYRHFPLDMHPKAPKEAEAAECAWDLGGNEKFWSYVAKVFSVTPSNNGLDPARLPELATMIGLPVDKFNECLSSGKFTSKVRADFEDGVKAGVSGTPHTVLFLATPLKTEAEKKISEINQNILRQMQPGSSPLITIDPSKKKVGISGAFQLASMKQIIDIILK